MSSNETNQVGTIYGTHVQGGTVNGSVTSGEDTSRLNPTTITFGENVTVHEGGNTGGIRQNF